MGMKCMPGQCTWSSYPEMERRIHLPAVVRENFESLLAYFLNQNLIAIGLAVYVLC